MVGTFFAHTTSIYWIAIAMFVTLAIFQTICAVFSFWTSGFTLKPYSIRTFVNQLYLYNLSIVFSCDYILYVLYTLCSQSFDDENDVIKIELLIKFGK